LRRAAGLALRAGARFLAAARFAVFLTGRRALVERLAADFRTFLAFLAVLFFAFAIVILLDTRWLGRCLLKISTVDCTSS
jgi:hypothetical protein